jgi:hypothetical protein
MQERHPGFIAEKSADPGNLMGMGQHVLHGFHGKSAIFPRPDHQPAAIVRAADNDQGSGFDLLIDGKLLNDCMDDITIFQAENKHPAQSRL